VLRFAPVFLAPSDHIDCSLLSNHRGRLVYDAEGLVQEMLLHTWRGLNDFEGRASFRGWLYRIAANACLNVLASRANARRVLPETHGPPADQPATVCMASIGTRP
jgi:DNA-directed RNA polymerase specialized sigma24 family protein